MPNVLVGTDHLAGAGFDRFEPARQQPCRCCTVVMPEAITRRGNRGCRDRARPAARPGGVQPDMVVGVDQPRQQTDRPLTAAVTDFRARPQRCGRRGRILSIFFTKDCSGTRRARPGGRCAQLSKINTLEGLTRGRPRPADTPYLDS